MRQTLFSVLSRRGVRGKLRGYRGISTDRGRFIKLTPLSDENKTQIQEAMNKRYVAGNKALDLSNFGADQAFGGSSGAIGKLSDERVMDVVIDTIGQHLADLEALSLTNNNLRTLRGKQQSFLCCLIIRLDDLHTK